MNVSFFSFYLVYWVRVISPNHRLCSIVAWGGLVLHILRFGWILLWHDACVSERVLVTKQARKIFSVFYISYVFEVFYLVLRLVNYNGDFLKCFWCLLFTTYDSCWGEFVKFFMVADFEFNLRGYEFSLYIIARIISVLWTLEWDFLFLLYFLELRYGKKFVCLYGPWDFQVYVKPLMETGDYIFLHLLSFWLVFVGD